MLKTKRQTSKTAKLNKPPHRRSNGELRIREYLVTHEVETLRKAARSIGRYGHRDETIILVMFRHALRVSELIALRWEQVDLKRGLLHVRRIKNGIHSTHPLRGNELRAFKQLRRDYSQSSYIFVSERNTPLTARTIHHIVARAAKQSNFDFTVHPHMLRHSTGFYLANRGEDTRAIQSYMGHANINNTTIYTELSPNRFNKFWDN